MENTDLYTEIDFFVDTLASVPASDNKSMFYNIDRILSSKNDNLFMELIGKEQYNKSLKMVNDLGKTVEICKEGMLEIGHKQFIELSKKSRYLNQEAKSYFNIYYLSGIAYYYYRIGNFEKAIACIFEELGEIEKFESMGVKNLHYKRIGVMINLIKIYSTNNNLDEATQLYLNLLLYLINGSTQPVDSGKWDAQLLESTPYIKQRALDLVFMDAINASITSKNIQTDYLTYYFEKVFSKIPDIEIDNNNQAMIWNWLYLQKLHHEKEYAQFVKDCLSFLKTEFDNSFDISKLALLSQIVSIINKLEIQQEKKSVLHSKINDFIQTKLVLLQYQKSKICSMLTE